MSRDGWQVVNLKRETYFALRRLRDSGKTPYSTLDEAVADSAQNAASHFPVLHEDVMDSLRVEADQGGESP